MILPLESSMTARKQTHDESANNGGLDRSSGLVLGDFRILREIGSGGMGTVYEAEQISLRRRVALKILPRHLSFSREAVLKFKREAEAGGRQHHSGIVSVYAVCEEKGVHYIVQEFIAGGRNLADRLEELREEGCLPPGYFRSAAGLIATVADALQHAHERGVIHRDIKPSNILLDADGSPKVTDFGLARVEGALALSKSGDISGTPYYMSPEQVARKRIGIDGRTDIFSLGVTLYEMLTLSRPFEGETSQDVLKKILSHDPRNPRKVKPRVPRDLAVICLKAMEKEPGKRYQTMAEFREDLQRYLSGDVIQARPAGPGTLVWKLVRRHPVWAAATSVVLLCTVGFLGYLLLWAYPTIKKERDIADMESEWALQAEKEARIQAHIAEERYDQVIRLSDVMRLKELRDESDALWPALPIRSTPCRNGSWNRMSCWPGFPGTKRSSMSYGRWRLGEATKTMVMVPPGASMTWKPPGRSTCSRNWWRGSKPWRKRKRDWSTMWFGGSPSQGPWLR